MARLLRVPEISAGATEVVLAGWPVAENVPYLAADVIATVETDKAVVDIEAEEDGVILRQLVAAGANVAVGQPIALIGVTGEEAGDIEEALRALGVQPSPGAVESATTDAAVPAHDGAEPAPAPGTGPAPGMGPAPDGAELAPAPAAGRPRDRAAATAASRSGSPTATGNGHHAGAGLPGSTQRIFVSPIARRLARDAALDLQAILGTGPNGRIMRRDVEQAIRATSPVPGETVPAGTAPAEPAPAETAPAETAPTGAGRPAGLAAAAPSELRPPAGSLAPARYTAVPHPRVRQAIASRMTESKHTVPHFYVTGSARADKLVQLRAELNDGPGSARVSVNDLVIKAVSRAHQLVPAMNVIWTPEALLCYESVDIGVAIASPRGLVTPVLRSVEQASVSALAAAVADLAERAAAGRLQQRELEGGTTCVSNLGMYGVEEFSAIINPPQSSILAVGAVHEAPVVEHGELRAGSVLRVTLSADHRAVDGTTAAEWMKAFVALIEHPVQILA